MESNNEKNEQPSPFYPPADPLEKEPPTDTHSTPATSDSGYDIPAAEPEWKPLPVEPTQQPALATAPATTPVSAGHIILQWLTYAFWGWTLLSLSWLTFLVFFYFLEKIPGLDSILPYALAANLVLLPISLVCDILYHRHERPKKAGISMAVMIIHAVLFALFGIGALIGAVFSLVQLFVGDGSTTTALATLLSFSVVAIMYAATFVRTLNPKGRPLVPRIYIIFMSAVVLLFVILAFVGPFAQARLTKNDRIIETNLSYIQDGINSYVDTNKKLPASLSDITVSRDAKQLVDKKLVEYKNEGEVPTNVPLNNTTGDLKLYGNADRTFHYQLCVNYQAASSGSRYYSSNLGYDDGYTPYVSTYNHPAGNVCYKLEKLLYSYSSIDQPLTGAIH